MVGKKSRFDRYVVKPNITLKNKLTGELIQGDIVNEEDIDGHFYYVLRNHRGTHKYVKEAFTILHSR